MPIGLQVLRYLADDLEGRPLRYFRAALDDEDFDLASLPRRFDSWLSFDPISHKDTLDYYVTSNARGETAFKAPHEDADDEAHEYYAVLLRRRSQYRREFAEERAAYDELCARREAAREDLSPRERMARARAAASDAVATKLADAHARGFVLKRPTELCEDRWSSVQAAGAGRLRGVIDVMLQVGPDDATSRFSSCGCELGWGVALVEPLARYLQAAREGLEDDADVAYLDLRRRAAQHVFFYSRDQGGTRERNSQLQSLISRPFSTRFG